MQNVSHPNRTYITTRNTQLAACLAAFQVPFVEGDPYSKVLYKGNTVTMWRFEMTSKAPEKWSTEDLINWWYSDKWFAKNYPKHPWSLAISAILTKDHLVDIIKNTTRSVFIREGKKTWQVTEGSEIHERLKKQLRLKDDDYE